MTTNAAMTTLNRPTGVASVMSAGGGDLPRTKAERDSSWDGGEDVREHGQAANTHGLDLDAPGPAGTGRTKGLVASDEHRPREDESDRSLLHLQRPTAWPLKRLNNPAARTKTGPRKTGQSLAMTCPAPRLKPVQPARPAAHAARARAVKNAGRMSKAPLMTIGRAASDKPMNMAAVS